MIAAEDCSESVKVSTVHAAEDYNLFPSNILEHTNLVDTIDIVLSICNTYCVESTYASRGDISLHCVV